MEDLEFDLLSTDGKVRRVSISGTAIRDENGNFVMSRSVVYDITERKAVELRIGHMATHDPLTGLPNRTLFNDRLTQVVSRLSRKAENVAMFILDLDEFKPINDKYGHEVGDTVLVAFSRRLQSCVREIDTVARLGGDEFGLILADVGDGSGVIQVAEKILDLTSQSITVGSGVIVRLGVSIGIAISGPSGRNVDTLVRDADRAMYASKAQGRNRFTISSNEH